MDLNLEKGIVTKMKKKFFFKYQKNVNEHEKTLKSNQKYKTFTFSLTNWQGYFIC